MVDLVFRVSCSVVEGILFNCNLLNVLSYWSARRIMCVCGWLGGWVRACVCVCTLLLLSIFLAFERFLAPCFIELLMFYC